MLSPLSRPLRGRARRLLCGTTTNLSIYMRHWALMRHSSRPLQDVQLQWHNTGPDKRRWLKLLLLFDEPRPTRLVLRRPRGKPWRTQHWLPGIPVRVFSPGTGNRVAVELEVWHKERRTDLHLDWLYETLTSPHVYPLAPLQLQTQEEEDYGDDQAQ